MLDMLSDCRPAHKVAASGVSELTVEHKAQGFRTLVESPIDSLDPGAEAENALQAFLGTNVASTPY